jgi:hypothetical protein
MLDQVARLEDGQEVATVSGHQHKAEISTRLGRC